MKRAEVLRVELGFLPAEDGGRRGYVDLSDGRYRTVAAAGVHDSIESTQGLLNGEPLLFGIALQGGPSYVWPGEVVQAELVAPVHPPGIDQVADAGKFTVFDGDRVIARGTVITSSIGIPVPTPFA